MSEDYVDIDQELRRKDGPDGHLFLSGQNHDGYELNSNSEDNEEFRDAFSGTSAGTARLMFFYQTLKQALPHAKNIASTGASILKNLFDYCLEHPALVFLIFHFVTYARIVISEKPEGLVSLYRLANNTVGFRFHAPQEGYNDDPWDFAIRSPESRTVLNIPLVMGSLSLLSTYFLRALRILFLSLEGTTNKVRAFLGQGRNMLKISLDYFIRNPQINAILAMYLTTAFTNRGNPNISAPLLAMSNSTFGRITYGLGGNNTQTLNTTLCTQNSTQAMVCALNDPLVRAFAGSQIAIGLFVLLLLTVLRGLYRKSGLSTAVNGFNFQARSQLNINNPEQMNYENYLSEDEDNASELEQEGAMIQAPTGSKFDPLAWDPFAWTSIFCLSVGQAAEEAPSCGINGAASCSRLNGDIEDATDPEEKTDTDDSSELSVAEKTEDQECSTCAPLTWDPFNCITKHICQEEEESSKEELPHSNTNAP